jgi:UDP-N-acetylmuramate dehydrogenase
MPYQEALNKLYNSFRENGILCQWDEPMSKHTSFQIGGNAALAVWPSGKAQMILVLSLWRELGNGCPLRVLGKGSNVLVSDKGFHGLVVLTTKAKRVVYEEDEAPDREAFRQAALSTMAPYCRVYAECGAPLKVLSYICGQPDRELSGLEFACGIPGTVGGAIVMNAGAYGSDIQQILVSADYYDLTTGQTGQLRDSEMDLSYRHSIFLDHPDWIVLSGVFKLSYGYGPAIREQMKKNRDSRKEKQPVEYPSAGSVFKRPVDNFAAKMIDMAGLKGVSVGGAQISEKHAGFIINTGGATAEDVKSLVRLTRDEVEKIYRYRLECEIRLVVDGITDTDQW